MKRAKLFMMLMAATFMLSGLAFGEVLLIANSSVSQTTITKKDVNLIFLGKKKKWDNGQMIKPAVLKEGDTHNEFLNTYVEKTESKFASYWKLKIVSGTGFPPKNLVTEAEVVDYVSGKEGAIGYISSSTPHDNVKVMTIE